VNTIAELTGHADRSLLIVEDDNPFLERCRAPWKPAASTGDSLRQRVEGLAQIGKAAPAFAVVDLRLVTATALTGCRR